MSDSHAKLWDLVYGLLEEAEAEDLRRQIAGDRELAKQYARIKLRAELIASAAKAPQLAEAWSPQTTSVALKPQPAFRLSAARRAAWGLSAALSLGLLLYVGGVYWSDDSPLRPDVAQRTVERLGREHVRLMVTGPAQVRRGEAARYEVTCQRLDNGEPVEAPVETELADISGRVLWRGRTTTSADGKTIVELPSLTDEATCELKLAVANESQEPAARLNTWLEVAEPPQTRLLAVNRVATADSAYFRMAELSRSEDETEALARKSDPRSLERSRMTGATTDVKQKFAKQQANSAAKVQLVPEQAIAGIDAVTLGAQTVRQHSADRDMPGLTTSSSGDDAVTNGELGASDAPAPELKFGSPHSEKSIAENLEGAPKDVAANVEAAPVPPRPSNASQAASFPPAANDPTPAPSEVLVESITVDGSQTESRIVDGAHAGKELKESLSRAAHGRRSAVLGGSSVTASLWDYSTAPPLEVLRETEALPPAVEPLSIEVRFDRGWYLAGEEAVATIQVRDAEGNPAAATLNVQLEAVPASLADTPPPASSLDYSVVTQSSGAPSTPLVFDNANEQKLEFMQAVEQWTRTRQSARFRVAATLLAGAVLGLATLMAMALLHWLPHAKFWVPAALVLSGCFVVGVFQLRDEPQISVAANTAPLTTYGVRTSPPPSIPESTLSLAYAGAGGLGGYSVDRRAERFAFGLMPGDAVRDYSVPAGGALAPTTGMSQSYFAETGFIHFERSSRPAATEPSCETIYWEPAARADEQGVWHMHFHIPSGAAWHRINVFAHDGTKLGSLSVGVPTVVISAP
jgi:hypothetical protein